MKIKENQGEATMKERISPSEEEREDEIRSGALKVMSGWIVPSESRGMPSASSSTSECPITLIPEPASRNSRA